MEIPLFFLYIESEKNDLKEQLKNGSEKMDFRIAFNAISCYFQPRADLCVCGTARAAEQSPLRDYPCSGGRFPRG